MDDQRTDQSSSGSMSRGFTNFLIVFVGVLGYIALSGIGYEFFMWLHQKSGQPPWIINSATLVYGFIMTLLPFVAIGACFKRIGTGAICGTVAFLAIVLCQVLA
jgi:hypothetical protein